MELTVAILLVVAAFYALAVVTEAFFVPAIDKIAGRFKLSSDAAGATLLAVGSSAPEFFTALFAILGLTAAEADFGAGTIVGSAIFNVLVIVGVAALFKTVKLQWQPVIRDQVFYILTILLLLWAFWDGRIILLEAVSFVLMYMLYVTVVIHWRKLLDYSDISTEVDTNEGNMNKLNALMHHMLSYVIPDPHKKPRLYGLTFAVAIGVIAGLSWLLVEQIISIADFFTINPTFLALTVLAAGTSIPDLIGSTVVAKQGRGDMAISNAIGSNVFDILFGLGLPWLIVLLIRQDEVPVSRDNLAASVMLLFATVVAVLFLLIVRKWQIGQKSGLVLIGLYLGYCVYILSTVAL